MRKKLNKSAIDALAPRDREYLVWDTSLSNFGIRVQPSGRKSFLIQYRHQRRTRRYAIGPFGPLTVQQARLKAKELLGQVALGEDPSHQRQLERKRPTIATLCDEYLEEGCATKKATTIATDRGRIARHIKPLLGSRRVDSIQRADVERFMQEVANGTSAARLKTKPRGIANVRGGKGTATRTVGLLGSIFTYAVSREYCDRNPVRGVKKFPDKKRDRYLSAEEFGRLGLALDAVLGTGADLGAVNAIRLLALTGCRKGEVVNLRWQDIDWCHSCLMLPDSKTGQREVPISADAMHLLRSIVQADQDCPWVFPNRIGDPLKDLRKTWLQVCNRAQLSDLRLHDLRHSFASMAINSGHSLYAVSQILGHKSQQTTMRYAHLSRSVAHETADSTSSAISGAMGLSVAGEKFNDAAA